MIHQACGPERKTMACTHRTPLQWVWRDVEVSPFDDTERQLVQVGGNSTYEDIDVGRFRCTQCGEVGYYTGQWRDFFEKGIPCLGSDRVQRATITPIR
jgi:hypothetical protein